MSVLDILPKLAVQQSKTALGGASNLRSLAEVISTATGSLPGAEAMFQKLLEIRAELGGPDKAKAEREAAVREFHPAPLTYNGFGTTSRRPPSMTVYILA